jgi:hypothetical protein
MNLFFFLTKGLAHSKKPMWARASFLPVRSLDSSIESLTVGGFSVTEAVSLATLVSWGVSESCT